MRGTKAKIIRRTAEKLAPPGLPPLVYEHNMVPMKIFIDPITASKFPDVKFFKGSPYVIAHYPHRTMGPCIRRGYQILKDSIKKGLTPLNVMLVNS